jgi:hypothetical protein
MSAAKTGRVTAGLGGRRSGTVSRLAQKAAEVGQLLCVDVLVARGVEGLALAAEGDEDVTFVGLLDRCHRVEQREDRVPLDVVTQRVPEDLRQRVPLVAVQVPRFSHMAPLVRLVRRAGRTTAVSILAPVAGG